MSVESIQQAVTTPYVISNESLSSPGEAVVNKVFEEMFIKLLVENSSMFDSKNDSSLTAMGPWKDLILNGFATELTQKSSANLGQFIMQANEKLEEVKND